MAAVEESERYVADVREPFEHCLYEKPKSLQAQLREFNGYLCAIGHPQAETVVESVSAERTTVEVHARVRRTLTNRA